MWLRVLEFVLSAGSYMWGAWTRIKQKQAIEAQLKQEQEKADEKAIQSANTVRANTGDNLDLLLAPKDRASHNED